MFGSIRPLVYILTSSLALAAATRTTAADEKEPPRPDATAPKADGASEYTLPGEDPAARFVPKTPLTVEDRRRIEALSDYSAARALEDRNAWGSAIAKLEEALKLDPDSVAILRRLSRLCFALRRTDKALDYARRALAAEPDDTETIERVINHYVRRGGTRASAEAAVGFLKTVLANAKLEKDAPARLVANTELARLYFERLQEPAKAADALALVLDALDEKAANRLSPRDQRRVLGDDPADTYLEFGRILTEAKREELAARAFERGLVYDPDHPELPLRLAEARLKQGKTDEALGLVERYLKRQPQGGEGYELLAKVLTALHREKEITPRLEEAAKRDSKNLLLQYALADRYRETGQVEKAEALYKSLLNTQPTPMGYSALATALLKRKKTDDLLRVLVQAVSRPGGFEAVKPHLQAIVNDRAYALELIDRGVKLLQSSPPGLDRSALRLLYVVAGSVAKTREDSGEDAAQELNRLAEVTQLTVKLEPSPIAYKQLLDAQNRQGKHAEAAKTIEQLLEHYPDERNARTLGALGQMRLNADQKDAAITAFREALKIEPNDLAAQFQLAMALGQSGKASEGVEVLRAALKNDPGNRDLNRMLGYLLTQAGKSDEAIAHYKGLLEKYPDKEEIFKDAHSGLSVIYSNQGDYKKAEAELEVVFQRWPDDPGVNNDLGYLYADQGKNLEKAESMIRKALQEKPEDNAYLDSLGWVLFKRGKPKEALEPLEKAVRLSPPSSTDATIFEHLGDVYFQLKDYGKARSSWEKAERVGAKATPPDKRLPEIRKKLKALEQSGVTPNLSAGKTP